ncbi:MAG: hypothetical protein HRT57_07965 [Crocinitomicaceae bacterium]|nr:hypothetical protein [Crocinitomicaceae bacterium]
MKNYLILLALFLYSTSFSQEAGKKLPSYFGIQVRPLFPTSFIGSPETSLSKDGFNSKITQKMGYSFGGTVRIGLTKLIALETGLNFTERNFDLEMSVPDSNAYATNSMSFIEYDAPLNALFYVQLAESWYMNASIGFALTYKPTDVSVFNSPGGENTFTMYGIRGNKVGIDANANIGFEFRTKKKGFFYLGGSARVPFGPVFNLLAQYRWQGNKIQTVGEVDGSFLAIDFKYFFPNIKNKGPQFHEGPIE